MPGIHFNYLMGSAAIDFSTLLCVTTISLAGQATVIVVLHCLPFRSVLSRRCVPIISCIEG